MNVYSVIYEYYEMNMKKDLDGNIESLARKYGDLKVEAKSRVRAKIKASLKMPWGAKIISVTFIETK